VEKMSTEDTFVDALLSLVGLFGNGVEPLKDCNIIGLSIVKVDGQMRNSSFTSTLWDPGERWGLVSSGGNALTKKTQSN